MRKLIKTSIISTFLGFYLYLYLYFGENAAFPSFWSNITDMLLIIFLSNIVGYSTYWFNNFVVGLSYFKGKNLYQLITSILLNYLLILFTCSLLFRFYVFTFSDAGYSEYYNSHAGSALRFYILSFVIVFLFVLIDFSIRSFQKYSLAKVEALQIAREQSELQLDAFKIQLSPHFLFNNLNTLTHIVHKDSDIAENYIRNLSKTYDYILKNSKLDLVPLWEELEFIRAYSYLLNIRFGDSLIIDIKTDNDKKNFNLPPLSLQLLVENAVKHNSASPAEKLQIEISQMNDYIEVKNNLLKKTAIQKSTKVGLMNLRKRYAFFTDKEIYVGGFKYFTVKIPLIKIESK